MLRTLSVLVENSPGVLARISGLFARRAYNIYSLTVCQTENPKLSRMIIVVDAESPMVVQQVTKQLHKQVVVHKVVDITDEDTVNRELALVRVRVRPETRLEILHVAEVFRGRVVDFGRASVVVEITGDEGKIAAFLKAMRTYGVLEIVRTGTISLERSGT